MPDGGLIRLLFVQMGTKGSQVLARMEAGEWIELTHAQTSEIQNLQLGEVYWDTETRRIPVRPHLASMALLLQFVDATPERKIDLSFRDASTDWKIDPPSDWASDPVAAGWQKERRYYMAGAELPVLHSARLEVAVRFRNERHGECIGVFTLPPLLGVPERNVNPGDLFQVVIPQIEVQNTHEIARAISDYAQVRMPSAQIFTDGFPKQYTDVTVLELAHEFARSHQELGQLSFDSEDHEFTLDKTWWQKWSSRARSWF